jgi:hypothetical protein
VDLSKCQKRTLPLEKSRHVGEAIIEAVEHGEDEGVIEDNLLKITQSIAHPFESAAIVEDG